jgi:hypothetical protein
MGKIRYFFDGIDHSEDAMKSTFIGCSEDEILSIEETIEKSLPGEYKDFLRVVGRKAAHFFEGTDVFYPEIMELNSYAKVLLKENQKPTIWLQNTFVFMMHQGYEIEYFYLDGTEDPLVFQWYEGQERHHPGKSTPFPLKPFSDFIIEVVNNEINS